MKGFSAAQFAHDHVSPPDDSQLEQIAERIHDVVRQELFDAIRPVIDGDICVEDYDDHVNEIAIMLGEARAQNEIDAIKSERAQDEADARDDALYEPMGFAA